MTDPVSKKRLQSQHDVSSSSPFMLLFFAFIAGVFFSNLSHAEQGEGQWSIDSKSESDSSEVEKQSATSLPIEESQDEQAVTETAPLASEDSEVVSDSNNEVSEQGAVQPSPSTEQSPSVTDYEPVDVAPSKEQITPVVDLDPQLRDNLERQFQQIRDLQESENAFSEKLGEAYLGYGQVLRKAGRLDEARAMYANALHIVKINNGVNSIEQRPMLRAMFEMNYALGNTEKMEENVKRIIWLEKKYPDEKDDYSFDMVVKLGNHFLDRYLYRPNVSEASLLNLNDAARYLDYAVSRYGGYPMSELFMPYGELALVHFLRSKIQIEASKPTASDFRQGGLADLKKIESRTKFTNSYAEASNYLLEYLHKSQREGRDDDTAMAMLSIADLNLLFGRRLHAAKYYEEAWLYAQKLPAGHDILTAFDGPTELPAFKYSQARDDVSGHYDIVMVPLTLNLDSNGRVNGFASIADGAPYPELVKRAKRAARRLVFRPVIENGKMTGMNGVNHDVKVLVRRKKESQG